MNMSLIRNCQRFNLKWIFLIATLITIGVLIFNAQGMSSNWSGRALRALAVYSCIFVTLIAIGRYLLNRSDRILVCSFFSVLLIANIGVIEIFSVGMLAAASFTLGRLVLSRCVAIKNEKLYFLPSLSVGAAFLILLFSGLVFFKYNTQSIYFLILLIPILAFLKFENAIFKNIASTRASIELVKEKLSSYGFGHFYGFIFLSTYIISYCLFPTVTSDEHAVHLSMWSQLQANGQFVVNPQSQIWSVAPNTVALIHGVTSLLAGADTKGALNLYLIAGTLVCLFKVFKIVGLEQNDRLMLATLFMSTPLIAAVSLGLQTDLLLGFLSLASFLSILTLKEDWIPSFLSVIFFGAIALSAKLPGVLIAAPTVLVALIYVFKDGLHKALGMKMWFNLSLLISLALLLSIFPYIKAFYFTGNPVFPLYNSIFKSPFIWEQNFRDLRWFHGASLDSFWGLFYSSKKHMEVMNNYLGGFQYFLIVPIAAIISLFKFNTRLLLAVFFILAYFIPIFFSLQYLRYFYAVMPLASVVLAIYFLIDSTPVILKRLTIFLIYSLVLLNFYFMPGISWLFIFSPLSFINSEKREQVVLDTLPEVELNKQINHYKPNANVFMALGRPFGATLVGQPIYSVDYSYSYYKDRQAWTSVDDVLRDMTSWRVDFIYWDQRDVFQSADISKNLLREFLLTYGKPVLQNTSLAAFSFSSTPLAYSIVFKFSPNQFNISGAPTIDESSVILHSANDILSVPIDFSSYTAFKYEVDYQCQNTEDYFVAQLNWDNGAVYYRLLSCADTSQHFADAGLVPPGAKSATLYVSARTNSSVKVSDMSIGGR